MFLDNQITLCLQVNDITKQDIINRLIATSKQKCKVLQKVTTTMKHPLRLAMIHLDNVCDPKTTNNNSFQEKLKPIKFYFQLLRNSLNNFQDISSLSAGEFHTQSKQIDFYSICKQVLELINFSYSRKKIKFVFLVDSRINRHMVTDKTRLKQILTNLLTQVSKLNKDSVVYLIVNRLSSLEIEFKIYDSNTDIIGLGKEIILQDQNLKLYKRNSLIPRLNSINIELSHILILNLNKEDSNRGLRISKDPDPVIIEDEEFMERLSFKFKMTKRLKKYIKDPPASDDSGIQSILFNN